MLLFYFSIQARATRLLLACLLTTSVCMAQTKSKLLAPQQNVKPAQPVSGKDVVAVYPFTTSRDYSYDYALSVGTAVEAGLVRSDRFVVVERNRFGAIASEDRFKEANTEDVIKKASKLGAKTIVTGHVVGVSRGDIVDYNRRTTGDEYIEISLSFKIIDVETGAIKMSEIIRGKGQDKTSAGAQQNAYIVIDKLIRSYVAYYLPQRFKFMSVATTGIRKKQEYLDKFKIWGGSENGINVGDVLEIYNVSYITNPNTGKQVEEKQLLAQANIIEVNSGQTATCAVIDGGRKGVELLEMAKTAADKIVIEYKGNWYQKRTFLDALRN